jgi:hypothetical protein
MRKDVSPETKEMLKEQMELLDPVLLLRHFRDTQDTVMALSQNRTPEAVVAPDLSAFVSSLRTAWRAGEVRPTHRQEPKPGRWWRTRRDPFAEIWPVLLGWLEERPGMEAKENTEAIAGNRLWRVLRRTVAHPTALSTGVASGLYSEGLVGTLLYRS